MHRVNTKLKHSYISSAKVFATVVYIENETIYSECTLRIFSLFFQEINPGMISRNHGTRTEYETNLVCCFEKPN